MTSIEVFEDEVTGMVGLVIRDSSIVEYEGELCPGIVFTADNARSLGDALHHYADRSDE